VSRLLPDIVLLGLGGIFQSCTPPGAPHNMCGGFLCRVVWEQCGILPGSGGGSPRDILDGILFGLLGGIASRG